MEKEKDSKDHPVGNPYLKVIIIDDESSKISETLGVSDERYDALGIIVKDAFVDNKTITDTMVQISHYVKHANELAVSCFMLGALTEVKKQPPVEDLVKLKEALIELKKNLGLND